MREMAANRKPYRAFCDLSDQARHSHHSRAVRCLFCIVYRHVRNSPFRSFLRISRLMFFRQYHRTNGHMSCIWLRRIARKVRPSSPHQMFVPAQRNFKHFRTGNPARHKLNEKENVMFTLLRWKPSRDARKTAANRKTYRALCDLSDHELKDIGVSRSDLHAFQLGHDSCIGPRRR